MKRKGLRPNPLVSAEWTLAIETFGLVEALSPAFFPSPAKPQEAVMFAVNVAVRTFDGTMHHDARPLVATAGRFQLALDAIGNYIDSRNRWDDDGFNREIYFQVKNLTDGSYRVLRYDFDEAFRMFTFSAGY